MSRTLTALMASVLLAAACGSGDAGDATDSSAESGAGAIAEPTAGLERVAVSPDAPVVELAIGFNDAGFDLLRSLPPDENTIFSPTSIGHALLMMRAAADAPTATAIDLGFALPDGMDAHDAWNAVDQAVDASNEVTTSMADQPTPIVTIADRIWPRNSFEPAQEWVDLLATHHGADVETIDVDEPEASRARINQWVSDQTNELIPELLPAGFITGNTLLVLTDTVYFRADWQLPFIKYGTRPGSFANIDDSTTEVDFMVELEQSAPRALGDGWSAAELPYLGRDYSMLVIVPDDFEAFRAEFSQATLDEIDAVATSGPYELLLPQWETETAIDLLPWLTEMGAAPGVYPAIGDGFIDGAVHGAVITVDEIGTEAAAATAIGVAESGPPEPEFTIAADRPFLYVIRHVDSGMVLFLGQITSL